MRPPLVPGGDTAAPAPPEPPAPAASRSAYALSADTGERPTTTARPIRRTVATHGAGPVGRAAAEPREPGATGHFKAPEVRRRGEEPPTGTTDRGEQPGQRSANAVLAPGGDRPGDPGATQARPGPPRPPVTVSIGRVEVTVVQRPAAPAPVQAGPDRHRGPTPRTGLALSPFDRTRLGR
ncbi:hypothetical protein [Kitasatospora sp. NPDC050463]|uniref:hypothetical protein n=1 Tax=Kitasatospora sp. NPDC050463 TaxID=3155786 RepID=UPI00340B9FB8